ncbi:uncharacterized protein L969DRAFT_195477 [Mixia osmundae IAM 14324]|uniref:Peptidase A1 domain-containing protein n=1 Tax=Mixia osmundae (strain CBS 9802 / IAM 14324 / JCM 22182 / KY 12970) TaxID=764103 RepID=G7DWG4_MIXOS|nr:uncharacterized protein L969DRAFT_195477 [Mixia osmundae IAM 14324]KEI37326.1 hypothetical protein L969DRAFT_195477 [Mixia osmundae IAM 14324]GAA94924.1 hypothetical protein E5Q_01579 [Mixia osmundae IAM 14324]
MSCWLGLSTLLVLCADLVSCNASGRITLERTPKLKTQLEVISGKHSGNGVAFGSKVYHPVSSANGVVRLTAAPIGDAFLVATVGAANVTLSIDTASPFTIVGLNHLNPYVPGPTAVQTNMRWATLGSNWNLAGTIWTDVVKISADFVMSGVRIAEAIPSKAFESFYGTNAGLLGLGLKALSKGTIADEPLTILPTFVDEVALQLMPSKAGVTLNYRPTSSPESSTLSFGAIDTTSLVGGINYMPLGAPINGSQYWTLLMELPQFGLNRTSPCKANAFLNTQSTLMILPYTAGQNYINSIPGAGYQQGIVSFPQSSTPPDLVFSTVTGAKLTLPGKSQLLSPAEVQTAGLDSTQSYSWITQATDEQQYTIGSFWLERFLVYLDHTIPRIGIGATALT